MPYSHPSKHKYFLLNLEPPPKKAGVVQNKDLYSQGSLFNMRKSHKN